MSWQPLPVPTKLHDFHNPSRLWKDWEYTQTVSCILPTIPPPSVFKHFWYALTWKESVLLTHLPIRARSLTLIDFCGTCPTPRDDRCRLGRIRHGCESCKKSSITALFNFRLCVSVIQGARVWAREKEQLVPATVNSCGDGTLVVTTDYGEVRCHVHSWNWAPCCSWFLPKQQLSWSG